MCLYDYWSLQSYLGVFNSQKIVPCGTKKWNNWYLIAVSSHYTENTNMIWKPVESLINNWLCKKYLSSYLQIRFKKGSREVTKILSRDQNKNNKKGLEMTKYWLISCRSVMCIIRKDILCKDKVIQWKIIWIQASYVKYQKVEKDDISHFDPKCAETISEEQKMSKLTSKVVLIFPFLWLTS